MLLTPTTTLPAWTRVLVVVAHPDDESFGLGAIIDAFARAGAEVDVLCLTQGEASTLGAAEDLGGRRAVELRSAATEIGARSTLLRDYADGGLAVVDPRSLTDDVVVTARAGYVEGLLVFDVTGISGHPDHVAATEAAVRAGEELDVPVLAWTLSPEVADALRTETGVPFAGRSGPGCFDIQVDRTAQHRAIACHVSQAVPGSVLWRRLELQADREALVWLRPPVG
ncbi:MULTISPECIES: PIG-L deacetylase family protein [unclassified Ornithinimicrobium]|uniref:PIG-L deacetylase family protein n=1 Tax=unclassified Ornithinimicrobium TaxID=2615080 RepID=UPI00385556D5